MSPRLIGRTLRAQLAKKYHPDSGQRGETSAERFTEIGEAYEVLSDEKKRKQYDQFGQTGFPGMHDGMVRRGVWPATLARPSDRPGSPMGGH